jgi:hypothetical protein
MAGTITATEPRARSAGAVAECGYQDLGAHWIQATVIAISTKLVARDRVIIKSPSVSSICFPLFCDYLY